jgi:hypothetical protein
MPFRNQLQDLGVLSSAHGSNPHRELAGLSHRVPAVCGQDYGLAVGSLGPFPSPTSSCDAQEKASGIPNSAAKEQTPTRLEPRALMRIDVNFHPLAVSVATANFIFVLALSLKGRRLSPRRTASCQSE